MNIDWAFIGGLLSLKDPMQLRRYVISVDDGMLNSVEAREAFKKIKGYYDETGKIAPVQLVVADQAMLKGTDGIDAKFAAVRLRRRRAFHDMADPLSQAEAAREKGDILASVGPLERAAAIARSATPMAIVKSMTEDLDKLKKLYGDAKDGVTGIPFPWQALNLMTMGMHPETLTYFVGRPWSGKTFVIILIARHAWINGHRVLIISPEMSREEIQERFFTISAGVSYPLTVRGALGDLAEQKYFETMDAMHGSDGLFIVDDRLDPKDLEMAIMDCDPALVAVDSAYKIKAGRGSRLERSPAVVEWLIDDVAKRFKIAVAASTQFGRSAEKKKSYTLDTIGFTDVIGQDAHNVFGLTQTEDMKADGILGISPLKVRRMALLFEKEMVKINWNLEMGIFDEIEQESFKDEEYKEEESDLPF